MEKVSYPLIVSNSDRRLLAWKNSEMCNVITESVKEALGKELYSFFRENFPNFNIILKSETSYEVGADLKPSRIKIIEEIGKHHKISHLRENGEHKMFLEGQNLCIALGDNHIRIACEKECSSSCED